MCGAQRIGTPIHHRDPRRPARGLSGVGILRTEPASRSGGARPREQTAPLEWRQLDEPERYAVVLTAVAEAYFQTPKRGPHRRTPTSERSGCRMWRLEHAWVARLLRAGSGVT